MNARLLTKDRDERQDLIQEARLALWQVDASRCDIRNRAEVRYLRKLLINHMRDVAARRGMTMDGRRRAGTGGHCKTVGVVRTTVVNGDCNVTTIFLLPRVARLTFVSDATWYIAIDTIVSAAIAAATF